MQCGLLGRKLGHSYSPQIHRYLGNYTYNLFEKEPEEVEHFLRHGNFTGINVTMPYKQTVIPYLDQLSPLAKRLGAVNTIVRRSGKLIGHNTDYFGFASLVRRSGLEPRGKKCLILGSGGVSRPALAVLEEMGAQVLVISHRENTPEHLRKHRDAAILVNATPVGMYPNNGASPVDLDLFPRLEGVLDLIFNPARTALMLQAEQRGLISIGGLWMLVAQAKEASEWFSDSQIPDTEIEWIHGILQRQMENIILIGMPGCGKTTLGRLAAQKLGKAFMDADETIVALAGKTIPEIFAEDGEPVFRTYETEALTELGKQSGLVIATGGGCVTQARNHPLLHQNGRIFWLQRELQKLPTEGRPLSQSTALDTLYRQREPLYAAFADYILDNNGSLESAFARLQGAWEELQ